MRKSLVATALTAASIAGIGAGVTLGFSGTSNAQTAAATDTSTTAAATTAPDRATIVNDTLAKLVTAGTITQAQADAVAKALTDALPARGAGGGDHRGGIGRGNELAVAAKAIGITDADLRTALQGGKTIAQVAADHSVATETVAAALKADLQTRLAQAVTDGKITQAEADTRLAAADTHIANELNQTGFGRGGLRGGHGPAGATAPAAPATQTTGS